MIQDSIYCLKIKHVPLKGYSSRYSAKKNVPKYFPYDRIYLYHETHEKTATRLFSYYLYGRVIKPLHELLNKISCSVVSSIPVKRASTQPLEVVSLSQLLPKIDERWVMLIPTSVSHKTPEIREIKYLLSPIVRQVSNYYQKPNLPLWSLHTPEKDIAAVCAVCKNQASYFAGECSLGTPTCAKTHNIVLAFKELDARQSENVPDYREVEQ